MAIQGFFTGDVKIRDLNGVLKAVEGIVEVATDAGTVTSVGLTVGSTGTDVNVANSPVTTSGNITLNLPTASATNRGLLSASDWTSFNSKQGTITLTTTGNNGSATLVSGTLNIPTYTLAGLGGISLTSLSASSPLLYNNTTGAFSIQVANGSQNGYLSSTDWTTFNSKQSALTFSSPLVNTSGTISIPAATSSVNGYLTSTDWSTFNNKQATITLTTTGSSGAATLIGATLNIPNYGGALTGYVPYTGATGDVDLGVYKLSLNKEQFASISAPTYSEGLVWYDSAQKSLSFYNDSSLSPVYIGENIVLKVYNNTGSTISKGAPVYIQSGGSFTYPNVALAKADNASTAAVIGLMNADTPTGSFGYVTSTGVITGVNTGAYSEGTILYLSPYSAGQLMNTIPPTGYAVQVGVVAHSNSPNGTIYTKQTTPLAISASTIVGALAVANGGTGATTASGARTNLGLVIGTDILAYRTFGTAANNNTGDFYLSTNPSNYIALTALSATAPLSYSNTTGVFSISQATTSTNGYLSSTDWNTFNSKQASGSYITALTGEATASGPGSASVTLSTSAVTGKLLTGLNLTGGGTIAATDSILQAFGKVQNQISGLVGGVTYQGTWNASTNNPTLTSSVGTKGYYYVVNVAGSTNLNGITDWKVGDWAIFNGSTWDKVDNTDAVSSVNGFTGAVSLTTSNISEGTNLYYLDSRARLALSFTAGSGAYNNTTGVITIPTNTSQLTNGANFITLSSLSASSPLAYNSGTGAFSIQVATGAQNGYLSSTDWTTFNGKQNALTLTTTGSSGSATLVGATLNIPTYTLSGLGGVPTSRQLTINGTAYDLSADRSWSVGTHTGSLTSGYIPKATGSTTLTDGLLYDTGSAVLLGTVTAGSGKFMVYSATPDNHYQAVGSAPSFRFADTIVSPSYTGIVGLATASNHFIIGSVAGDMVLSNNTSSAGNFLFGTGATERMRINATTGNVSIGNTGNTFKLEVTGTTKISGQLTLGSTITDGTYTYTLPSATGTIALVGGSGVGTVTSVAALTIGTSGTDLSSTVANSTTTPVITLNVPTASATNRGALSSADWTTFNNKQNALTNPVTGTGTTNYLPKFTGTSTIGNSIVYDDGTNIGIGTASPLVKLHVNGTGTQYFRLSSSTNSTFQQMGATSGGTFLEYKTLYRLVDTDNGTRLTLDASGNLGLGVTPSAGLATANYRLFEIGLDGGGSIYSGSNQTLYGTNISWVGGTPNYVRTGSAPTLYNQSNGVHSWSTAPTGTAGNAISFTQAMTLNASGNLSVGNTNDSYKLDVTGTGRFTGRVQADGYSTLPSTGSTISMGFSGGTGYLQSWSSNALAPISIDGSTFAVRVNGFSTTALSIAGTGAATFSGQVSASNFYATGITGFWSDSYDVRRNGFVADGTNLVFRAGTSSTGEQTRMVIAQATGNVGIGTTSPGQILTIDKGASTAYIQLIGRSRNLYLGQDSTGANIYSDGDAPMYFSTNGSERMRITSGGNVGIGTTSPSYKLHVSGTSVGFINPNSPSDLSATQSLVLGGVGGNNAYIQAIPMDWYAQNYRLEIGTVASSTAQKTYMTFFTEGSERMRITSGGNVGINTSSPSYTLDVNGTARFGSAIVASLGTGLVYSNGGTLTSTNPSDQRLKNNIQSISYGLNEILKLNPVTFDWKEDKINQGKQYGFIAQEVQKVMPDLVKNLGIKDYLGLDKEAIFTILVKAIQELNDKIK